MTRSLRALDKIAAKIPRVEAHIDGLTAVLAKDEIRKRGEVVPLTEEGRLVRERLLQDNLSSLASLYRRKTTLQMETSNG